MKAKRVYWQQEQMQTEHRGQPSEESVCDEPDIADDREHS